MAENQGQYGYGQQTVIVATQPVSIQLGIDPVRTTCPICSRDIVSSITRETGTMTWLACLGLCVIGCDLGCCFIPFCVDSCKDTVHHCPNCNAVLGRRNAM